MSLSPWKYKMFVQHRRQGSNLNGFSSGMAKNNSWLQPQLIRFFSLALGTGTVLLDAGLQLKNADATMMLLGCSPGCRPGCEKREMLGHSVFW